MDGQEVQLVHVVAQLEEDAEEDHCEAAQQEDDEVHAQVLLILARTGDVH